MKIFVGIPNAASCKSLDSFKQKLAERLKIYYGAFTVECVKTYFYDKNYVSVFVMDSATFPGHDSEIADDIAKTAGAFFPSNKCEVKLNYGKTEPGFNPVTAGNSAEGRADAMNRNAASGGKPSEEFDYEKLSENYQSEEPRYSFSQVILPDALREQILEAVGTIQVEEKVFDKWGLRSIIPNASSAISFYGPPGTGKSMAAEAIAQRLGKRILRATYADIESKFHGEGPKMVKAIFLAAQRDNAVLFLDESDSLLSKRLTNVSDGSAQAINSMRSQLLICLEQFKGIVIFATNLVVNYDRAFLSRLINIEFTMPDEKAREAIWEKHLRGEGLRIPLAADVNTMELAKKFEFCGREIKNSVKDACVTAALSGRDIVCQADLLKAAEKTRTESAKVLKTGDHTKAKLSDSDSEALKNAVQKKLDSAQEKKLGDIAAEPER